MIRYLVLALGVVSLSQGGVPVFKTGAYVDVLTGGSWRACVISGSYRAETNEYPVSCEAQDLMAKGDAAHLRMRKPTVEDVRVASETAAALARGPRTGKLGGRYGTREPKVCESRSEPAKGPISAQQAREYFICDTEGLRATSMVLVTNVKIEVAQGRKYNAQTDSRHASIDQAQPVFDIRGSYRHYDCYAPGAADNAFARTHNCSAFDELSAQGLCFKNTFGDWHCVMYDLQADILNPRKNQLPPEGN